MAVRIKDIAKDLGLSPMAVSKALRGHTDISEKTRKRVAKRAAELDYRVDLVARSMVTGKSFVIGLVVPDLMQSFFGEIVTACTARLARGDYHVMIVHSEEDAATEREDIALLSARKVDGFIIATAQRAADAFDGLQIPYVLIDREVEGATASFVGSDDHEIGRLATSHLVEQGCRRIAHLRGPHPQASDARFGGYRDALEAANIDFDDALVIEAGHTDDAGFRAMNALLEGGIACDGVFAFNDPVAVGAMRAAFEAGLSIPVDLAVIGAANMRNSDMLRVPLSSIDQRTDIIGARAADLLMTLIDGKHEGEPQRVVTPVELVARASTQRI